MTGKISTPLQLILVLVVGGSGYFLGSAAAPNDQDAISVRRDASNTGFAAAYGLALASSKLEGTIAGSAKGLRLGISRGRAAGTTSARRDLETRTPLQAASVTTESEAQDVAGAILPGAGEVLVVGDSLEVATSPYLKRYLRSVPFVVKAEVGYSSLQIFEVFQQNYESSQSVVVFDAGTNDDPAHPEILAARLQAVADLIGDRCMVVPTIHAPTVNGVGSEGKNRVIRQFAASRPGTQVPNWGNLVATHPELLQSDDLHPSAEGADVRAQLIAQGVQDCLSALA